jgi:hypothetical protein
MLNTFSCTGWPFLCLFWRNAYSDHLPIFKCIISFPVTELSFL